MLAGDGAASLSPTIQHFPRRSSSSSFVYNSSDFMPTSAHLRRFVSQLEQKSKKQQLPTIQSVIGIPPVSLKTPEFITFRNHRNDISISSVYTRTRDTYAIIRTMTSVLSKPNVFNCFLVNVLSSQREKLID